MIDYKKKYNKYKFKYLNAKKLIYGGFWRGGSSEPSEPSELNVDKNDDKIDIFPNYQNDDKIDILLRYEDNDEIIIDVDPSSNVHKAIKTHLGISENQQISINLGNDVIIEEDETFKKSGIGDSARISAKISTSLPQKIIDSFNRLVYNTNTITTGPNATLPGPIKLDSKPRTNFYDDKYYTERAIEEDLTRMINTLTNEQLLLIEKHSLEKKTNQPLVFNVTNLSKFQKRIDFILTQVRIAKLERKIPLNKEDLFDLKVFEHQLEYNVKEKLKSNLQGITKSDLTLLKQYVIQRMREVETTDKKLIERIKTIWEVLN